MKWSIVYHELFEKEDRKVINPYHWQLIINTIDKKLTNDPINYGKPLRGNLKKFYKLSIDKYRVIYQIKKGKVMVWIVKIGPRKDNKVYIDFLLRMKHL